MDHVRLLPWTGANGQPSLLVSGGDGPVARIADRVEAVQLALADRLLGRAQEMIAAPELSISELGALTAQLTEALRDVLLIAECRGARLGAVGYLTPQYDTDIHEGLLAHTSAGIQALAALALPGADLASARVARRCVRNMAEFQNLPSGAVDDLETITGELVANALEHSDSRTVTVTPTVTAETATVSVTDEGEGYEPAVPAPTRLGQEKERGRGLLITDVLAARRGKRQTNTGLTVWAEVNIKPSNLTG
ncbi:ATP-binding protein [Streptomyces sp. AK08-02]|uniref:ATP-binding protein n=1 Tax=Streptomyces sp. AK08-02 TaxID=3028654 RepID=UPI0029B78C01|nr:ATP-binding protein [Streptomyces sp. AK08-02]MDX3752423.1 ATP-binding protein [Streptomyces sp. AK08-02]